MNTLTIIVIAIALLDSDHGPAAEPVRLENDTLALRFDAASGSLTAVENKLAGETYVVNGDEVAVEAVEFAVESSRLKPAAVNRAGDTLTARYDGESLNVDVAWTLPNGRYFAEKRMTLTARQDYGLKKVVVSRPTCVADGLELVAYRYPQFGRAPGTEPICTYFGRTAKGDSSPAWSCLSTRRR